MRILIVLIGFASRLLAFLSRTFKKGSGTSIAGLFIEKWFVWSLSYFQGKYQKIVYISGTNGKTTTRQMIVKVLQPEYKKVISNYGGANIMRGIATSLFRDLDWLGRPKSKCAVLEVEEATLPRLSKYLQPTLIVLTNLARDQLDAYGELDITFRYFDALLKNAPCAQLILNYDDPRLRALKAEAYIGVSLRNSTIEYERGGGDLIAIQNLMQVTHTSDSIIIKYNDKQTSFTPKLKGEYNAVNYGLAAAVGCSVNIALEQVSTSLESVEPVFGRGEVISTPLASHRMVLVKNPLGFGSVLKIHDSAAIVLIGVQDKVADGKDVSWLWDVEFEKFPKLFDNALYTSGTRAGDIALRLGQAARFLHKNINVAQLTLAESCELILSSDRSVDIYGTYTFCMELRSLLAKHISLPPIDSENF